MFSTRCWVVNTSQRPELASFGVLIDSLPYSCIRSSTVHEQRHWFRHLKLPSLAAGQSLSKTRMAIGSTKNIGARIGQVPIAMMNRRAGVANSRKRRNPGIQEEEEDEARPPGASHRCPHASFATLVPAPPSTPVCATVAVIRRRSGTRRLRAGQ